MARALQWGLSITAAVALYALPLGPLLLAGLTLARTRFEASPSGGSTPGDTGSDGWQSGVPLLMAEGLPGEATDPSASPTPADATPPPDDPTKPASPKPATTANASGSPDGKPEGKAEGTSPDGAPDGKADPRAGWRNAPALTGQGTGSGSGEGGGSSAGTCQPTKDPRIRKVGEHTWEIDREILDEYATDWVKLDALGSAWPMEAPDGKVRGIKLMVERCGVGFQGGMRSGDIVRTVGGRKISSVTAAVATWLDIRNDKEIKVVFVRRGELVENLYVMR